MLPCDGDALTDVTRYSKMNNNPETQAWYSPTGFINCPPFHIDRRICRNDTVHFP